MNKIVTMDNKNDKNNGIKELKEGYQAQTGNKPDFLKVPKPKGGSIAAKPSKNESEKK